MESPQRLQIAQRIHLGLTRELGVAIDVPRLLRDAVYARDVLLVCDAHVGAELADLSAQFRAAATAAATPVVTAAASERSGSAVPRPPRPDPPLHPRAATQRRWHQPSSWFAR